MRKGILLIGGYPPPFGGIASHIQYLAPYLCEKEWDVHILSGGNPKGIERRNSFTIYRPSKTGKISKAMSLLPKVTRAFEFKSFALHSPREFFGCLTSAKFITQIVKDNRNISIISAYHLFPEGFVGALASEELSVPLIVTNFGEIYTIPHFYKKQLRIVKNILDRSEKILSVSQHCARSYSLLGLLPEVEVISYGIDVGKFSPNNDGAVIRQRFSIGNGEQLVLFVGRMIRDMGLHTLLEAIPQVLKSRRAVKFVIAGAKGELYEPALNLQSRHEKNVVVVPNIPFDELPYYYAASTVVVAPTPDNRACMGMAIKEAMASGKPVIASRIGGIPEAIVDGETGILLPPEDPSALAEAILGLLDDKEVMARMGRCGRERAENLFDKDKTNQRLEKIFREIGG